MKSEENNEINHENEIKEDKDNNNIENTDSKENIELEKKRVNEEQMKTFENKENNNNKLNKSKEIKLTEAPPSIGEKIFIIDDNEFYYTINELENKDGIYIKLEEVKPKNNIYFLYETSTKELIDKIKFFDYFDDNEQRINSLHMLFNNDKVKIIKKEDKYFMILEISFMNIDKKFEIELIKIEIFEQMNNDLINNIKYLSDIVKDLKNDINELKKVKISSESDDSKIININNLDMNTLVEDIIKKIDIKDKINEALNGKEVHNIQNNSNINISEEKTNLSELENDILEKIKVSMNEIINEKLQKKEEDEKLIKERMDKIENSINDKFNEINQIIEKIEIEKINGLINDKFKNYQEDIKNQTEKIIKIENDTNEKFTNINNIIEKLENEKMKELINDKFKNYQEDIKNQVEKIDKIENDTNEKFNYINNLIKKLENEKINEILKNEMTKTEEEFKKINKNIFDSYNKKIAQKINNIKNDCEKQLLSQMTKIFNENKYNNYITLKLNIDKNGIGSDIRLLRQHEIYKRKFNFEIDDIIIKINDINIPFMYKYINSSYNYETEKIYEFYWTFEKKGEYIVQIIFKNPLSYCNNLFSDCKYLTYIDLSNFDGLEVRECCYMFNGCSSLKKIKFGKLDFNLVTDFSYMFYNCSELEDLDVSGFNTKNAYNFNYLFSGCKKLKKIDISKFDTSSLQQIDYMFCGCERIEEIDMIKWDMKNISSMTYLCSGCSSLTKIKMSCNFKDPDNLSKNYSFNGVPESGEFYYIKKMKYKPVLSLLGQGWDPLAENSE